MEGKIVTELNTRKRWHKGRIVRIIKVVGIVMFIVLSLLYYILLRIGLHHHHCPTNDSAALATCSSFGSAALIKSSLTTDKHYWDTYATLGNNFNHVPIKGGYIYTYLSNGTLPSEKPEDDNATKFMYVAIPVSEMIGETAYFVDETQTVYKADFEPDKVNWNVPIVCDWSVDGPKRLTSPVGVEWKVR